MIAPNTIPPKEAAQMYFEAARKITKQLSRLSDEEDSKSRTADNKGDTETALKHWFRSQVLMMAEQAITKSPAAFERDINAKIAARKKSANS